MSDDRPRYAHGSGFPPRHLASLNRERGELRFAGAEQEDLLVAFASEEELVACLARLIAARLPLASDRRIDGPAELAATLIENGRLAGTVIELSWRGPGNWSLREWFPGAVEWREAPAEDFASTDGDPARYLADRNDL